MCANAGYSNVLQPAAIERRHSSLLQVITKGNPYYGGFLFLNKKKNYKRYRDEVKYIKVARFILNKLKK